MAYQDNSTSYSFGQMGSAISDGANPVYPPKGMVIIAVTSLDDATAFNATNGLVSEAHYTGNGDTVAKSNFFNTNNAAHSVGDFTTTGHNNANNADHDGGFITLGAASAKIKPGMIVESATLCPRDLINPYVVKSHDGTTTAKGLVVSKLLSSGAPVDTTGSVASGAAEALNFFDVTNGQGMGGLEMDASDIIKTGVTIYGRWTAAILAGGRAIFYFGK